MSRPTIKDVANAAGVSLGTASRVLNSQTNVNPAIRARVEQAIAELGYAPDTVAQSMRRGATRTVGVLVRDITIPSLAGFVRAVQDELEAEGYAPLIACSDDRKERELQLMRLFERRRVDGMIMLSSSETDPDLVAAMQNYSTPVVLFDRATPDTLDSVLVEHYEGMQRAVSYLLGLGHLRIALITGSENVYPARERVRGYCSAYREAGIEVSSELIRARSFTDDAAFMEVMNLLDLPEPPTAIVAGGIAMISGPVRALRARGLRIPHDVSLIGASDSDLMQLLDPPITTIRWSYDELGRTSARLLLNRIKNPDPPVRRATFPTEFLIRGSCSPPTFAKQAKKRPEGLIAG